MASILEGVETVFVEVEKSVVDKVKEVVGDVKEFVLTEAQVAVSWLKTHASAEPLVTKTLNLISALSAKTMTGAEKMQAVISAIGDMVASFLAEGGFQALLSNALGIAREFAQSLYNDLKSGLLAKLGITLA